MADIDKIETRYNYTYIHNVIGHFMKDTLDYFADYLYPRFEWKVVSTYDKAVEYLMKNTQFGRETDMPMKPALILNPSGDWDFDDAGGKQAWRFPNLAPGFVKFMHAPLYQDQNIIITPAFSRIKGEMEFMALVDSFYEYADLKILIGLIFGGKDRYIYPQWFNSFIILPPEIYNYHYSNPYTGVSYTINILEQQNKLIKTTNQTEVVYPCKILPRYKMTGMSDGSARFGGMDKLPEWKLNFTLEYEVEIPTYLVLETDYIIENIKFNIKYGSCYSSNESYNNEDEIPINISKFTGEEIYYDSTGETRIDLDSTSAIFIQPESTSHVEIKNKKELVFNTRYFHIVTKEEAESTTTVDFTLPEQILDKEILIINGKYGHMAYGDNYIISEDGWTITIKKEYVYLNEGDILELYIYKWI